MADNLAYTPGAGASVATDDIGGQHHQRIKLVLGADGVSDGDVSSANPMPVRDVNHDDLVFLFQRMLAFLGAPLGYDKAQQRGRVTAILESGTVTTVTTVSTVTTCATVTNLSTIDTLQGRLLVNGQNVSAWHACVRSRIT